jgi:two-component system chemotaxis sensor kinase CheA
MKVEGKVFDDLIVTVGELFMELTSFKTLSQTLRSIAFKDTLHMLGKTVNKLHSNILSARMLPLGDLTAGLPRLIRDMSLKTGKSVRFATAGMEISLDRGILENLGGPLVHMIRNSMDHGIETQDERGKAGKPPEGSISIKAYARKDRVVLDVSDDGRGLDVEKIKVKAASRGISIDRIRSMSKKDLLMLVCMPGFTTSSTVTDTSGRGVGMDVVKSAIEGMGGTLEIDSAPGRGTTVRMELPRTTSIMKALLVSVSGELFLIPISKIEKVIELDPEKAWSGIIDYDGKEVPLVPLAAALGIEEDEYRSTYTVVVVEDPGPGEIDPVTGLEYKKFIGIRVDDFGEEIDAYIKPLVPPMSRLKGVSGITITGEGRPVFLVDLPNIISWTEPAGGGGEGGGAGNDH